MRVLEHVYQNDHEIYVCISYFSKIGEIKEEVEDMENGETTENVDVAEGEKKSKPKGKSKKKAGEKSGEEGESTTEGEEGGSRRGRKRKSGEMEEEKNDGEGDSGQEEDKKKKRKKGNYEWSLLLPTLAVYGSFTVLFVSIPWQSPSTACNTKTVWKSDSRHIHTYVYS